MKHFEVQHDVLLKVEPKVDQTLLGNKKQSKKIVNETTAVVVISRTSVDQRKLRKLQNMRETTKFSSFFEAKYLYIIKNRK